MSINRAAALWLLLFVIWTSRTEAQFANGDFSLGTSGCGAGTGWTTGTGNTSAERTSALIGGFWVDVTPCGGWGNGAWIEQAVPTVVGNCYSVTFDLGTVCGWDASDAGIFFSVNGSQVGPKIVNDSFVCQSNFIYYKRVTTQVFVATTNPSVLRFTGEGRCSRLSVPTGSYPCSPLGGVGNPGVIAVDNFVLNPVGVSGGSLFLGNDTTLCGNDTHILDAGPGMTSYLWNTGAVTQTIMVSNAGTYWCSVTSSCSNASDTIRISKMPKPVVDLGNDVLACAYDTVFLSPRGAYSNPSYSWSTGDTTAGIRALTTGTYIVRVEDRGCRGYDTVDVVVYLVPEVDLGRDTALCASSVPFTLQSSQPPGSTYLWSNGLSDVRMEVLRSGRYWLRVTDNGCVSSDTVNILVVPDPVVFIGRDTTICTQFPTRIGTQITDARYQWNTGDTTDYIDVNRTGTYIQEVNLHGCLVADTVQITAMPVPDIRLGNDGDICPEQTIALDASYTSGSSYVWNTGETTAVISVTEPGTYMVRVVSEHQCVGADTITLSYYPIPSVLLPADTSVCEEVPIWIRPFQLNADSLIWSDGTVGHALRVKYGGIYSVSAVNKCGSVRDTIELRQIYCDIWVPNAFSPNGDGLNDVFRILGNTWRAESMGLSIYNRWGERIFYTRDRKQGWDGTVHGEMAPVGTYLFLLEYSMEDKTYQQKGDFHLVR